MKHDHSASPLTTIPVFYSPDMVAANAGAYSPSAAKPAQVVADWQQRYLPVDIREFAPVTIAQLQAAHDVDYVDRILNGREANGFGSTDMEVTASLPYTSGAMLAAARAAIGNRAVACAPCSGFHHAGHAWGGGYCTFNGLMVSALTLKAEGLAQKVAILDLDHHYGDGTQDIINKLRLSSWVLHKGAGVLEQDAERAEGYLKRLPAIVKGFEGCDVLLYQAGADAHIDDPLGGWMTSEQLSRRDRIVFESARGIGLPVAWNLAGGYQRDESGGIEPVLAIHRKTMEACVSVYLASSSN